MTRKEFERFKLSLESQVLNGEGRGPLEFGMKRALFKRQKFEKLLAAAKTLNCLTVTSKVEQWQRQLARANATYERLRKLREGATTQASSPRFNYSTEQPGQNSPTHQLLAF